MKKVRNFKKVLLGLASMAVLVSSCDKNDDNVGSNEKIGSIDPPRVSFLGIDQTKATTVPLSTAIPVTSWDNSVEDVLVLFYDADGKVKFSDYQTSSQMKEIKQFTWSQVPVGTYTIGIFANFITSNRNRISNSIDGGNTFLPKFDYPIVKGKVVNTNIQGYLIKEDAATATHHAIPAATPVQVAYEPISEIFSAYSSAPVTIEENKTTTIGTPFRLKREVSLMRVRLDNTTSLSLIPQLKDVDFFHAKSYLAVKNMPTSFNIKTSTVVGGVNTSFDSNRLMIASQGTKTFETANPTSGYGAGTIIEGNYKLWKDVIVLPNVDPSTTYDVSQDLADKDKKYMVIIAGTVPQGYKYSDGTTAQAADSPVYFTGVTNGIFAPNNIRDVNLLIRTAGSSEFPVEIPAIGTLEITLGDLEPWNSNIQTEQIDI